MTRVMRPTRKGGVIRKQLTSKPTKYVAPKVTKPPKYADMVTDALHVLAKGRKGASRVAVLSHLAHKYGLPADNAQNAYQVKKALKSGVDNGIFQQLSGQGASGSFRLASKKSKKAAVDAQSATKTSVESDKNTSSKDIKQKKKGIDATR